jgi:hypothetical protein
LRGPQQSQSKEWAKQDHNDDEQHACRRQVHVEFPVSSAMDDIDRQVREDENSQVFVGAVHGVFVRLTSPDGGKLDGPAALTTTPLEETIRQDAGHPQPVRPV